MEPNIQRFACQTLVDITNTQDTRSVDTLERNQQRNWETVMQVISLRAQPFVTGKPANKLTKMIDTNFGTTFTKNLVVWEFQFEVEHPGVFSIDTDQLGTLTRDFEGVPFVPHLTETAKFPAPVFTFNKNTRNIWFREVINT